MRVILAVLATVVGVAAYDAVLFSSKQDVTGKSLEQLVEAATSNSPIVFIVNPDFTLGQFSQKANAFSGNGVSDALAKSVESSQYRAAVYFPNQIYAASASVLTEESQFASGSSIYVVAGEEWTSMETLALQVLSKTPSAVFALTSTDAVSTDKTRFKRVATDDMASDAASGSTQTSSPTGADAQLPLVLPPYNVTGYDDVKIVDGQTCLFYLEGLTVIVWTMEDKKTSKFYPIPIRLGNATWKSSPDYYECPKNSNGTFLFTLDLKAVGNIVGRSVDGKDVSTVSIPDSTNIKLSLNYTGRSSGYWELSSATLHTIKVKVNDKDTEVSEQQLGPSGLQYVGQNSVDGFALACSQSQAMFFNSSSSDDIKIGIAFYNTQVQLFNNMTSWSSTGAFFTRQVDDCVGTFSPGSWMGLISALVLIGGLLFGYLMLQSVQTMDRFDDPKQKQIIINVRE